MRIKDLLYTCNKNFYVYKSMYDESGQWIGYECIVDHETSLTDEIKNLKVENYTEGKNYLPNRTNPLHIQ